MASDYSAIVQQPKFAFRDPVLKSCSIERNALGQPLTRAGAFAVVYKGIDADGKAWALRAFTSECSERREHYEAIAAHLDSRRLRCLVDFEYREASIRSASDGKWYPLVVMDWVQGVTLFSWVQSKCRKDKGASIAKGARHWLKLTDELVKHEIAHGDLQQANVLVTPQGRLKLVDYDGMCVPGLIGRRNLEIGVRPYQHPLRNQSTLLSGGLDAFSAIVIYTALRALAADTSLWSTHVEQANYDKLLFRSEDFLDREQSGLYRDLMESPDAEVRTLAAQLFSFARGSLEDVPPLGQLVADEQAGKREVRAAVPGTPWLADEPDAPQSDKPVSQIVLDIVTGPLAGQAFQIDGHSTLLFGRGADCQIRVSDDRRISRHQFFLEAIPPYARLRELGSRNGTYINGVKYGGREHQQPVSAASADQVVVELKHGDQIIAGQTTLLLRVQGGPPLGRPSGPPAEAAEASVESPSAPERLLDRLSVDQQIGTGVLGTVYKAEDRTDQRQLALKIVKPKTELGKAIREQVLAELESALSLEHDNVLGVIEQGIVRRSFYFITEYCDAGSLDRWMAERGGKLILGQARPLMFQCLDGLVYAHSRGIVHGDLKPPNILLQHENRKRVARIADFGLSRTIEKTGGAGMTATGAFSIRFHFVPREQVVTVREGSFASDQWSLAAVFYHMLTGEFPRDIANRDALSAVLECDAVPIRERDSKVPGPVAAVIDQALSTDPEKRFRDLAQMKAHLKRAFDRMRG